MPSPEYVLKYIYIEVSIIESHIYIYSYMVDSLITYIIIYYIYIYIMYKKTLKNNMAVSENGPLPQKGNSNKENDDFHID